MVATGSTLTTMPYSRFSQRLQRDRTDRRPGRAPRRTPPPLPRSRQNGSGRRSKVSRTSSIGKPGAGQRRRPAFARQQFVEIGQALRPARDRRGTALSSPADALGAASAISISSWSPGNSPASSGSANTSLQARRPTPLASPCSSFGLDLVDGRQLQDQLHRQRPLVALDQVEIGRRDAKPLGHRRLGQALGAADAADARPREDLLFGHRHLDRNLHDSPATVGFYSFDKFTGPSSSNATQIFSYFRHSGCPSAIPHRNVNMSQ